MELTEIDDVPVQTRPRTFKVLGILAIVALTLSFLGAYAVPEALMNAELINIPKDRDPRMRWVGISFLVSYVILILLGGLFRWSSHRHLKSIDEMLEGEKLDDDDSAPPVEDN